MFVSLYISRIVLKLLGVEDFGIYNVVGGVITLFSYINSALTVSTQRFLTFEIGQKNLTAVKNVFCMGINIHVILAILFLLFAETVGLWILNNYLNIPPDRLKASILVYHISIIATFINIITIPYNSLIIAHEKMAVYAYLSIAEVLLKLGLIYCLILNLGDKLIMYALLMMVTTLIIRLSTAIYCKIKFEESKYQFIWDRKLFKDMFAFTGWNFLGATAGISMDQGVNILKNMFFGPIVNASRAIAIQVQSAFAQLSSNFMQAVNPQIVKSYASGEIKRMMNLILYSSKYSFLIMAITSMPFLIKMEFILNLWLTTVPENAVIFTKLMLLYQLTICLTYSINMASQASGNIKLFQIVESVTLLFILPTSYIILKIGLPAYSVFIAMILISSITLFLRIIVLRKIIAFDIKDFFKKVLFPISLVSFILIIVYFLFSHFKIFNDTLFLNLLEIFIILIISAIITYLLGLSRIEKQKIRVFIQKKNLIIKIKNRSF